MNNQRRRAVESVGGSKTCVIYASEAYMTIAGDDNPEQDGRRNWVRATNSVDTHCTYNTSILSRNTMP